MAPPIAACSPSRRPILAVCCLPCRQLPLLLLWLLRQLQQRQLLQRQLRQRQRQQEEQPVQLQLQAVWQPVLPWRLLLPVRLAGAQVVVLQRLRRQWLL